MLLRLAGMCEKNVRKGMAFEADIILLQPQHPSPHHRGTGEHLRPVGPGEWGCERAKGEPGSGVGIGLGARDGVKGDASHRLVFHLHARGSAGQQAWDRLWGVKSDRIRQSGASGKAMFSACCARHGTPRCTCDAHP